MIWRFIFLIIYLNLSNANIYDSYYGVPITKLRMKELIEANSVETCTNNIPPCNLSEGRRLDGSCNNLNHPSRGAMHTPQLRLLPAVYTKNFEPRKSKNGKPLELPRYVRQQILKVGKAISPVFVQTLSYFAEFIVNDILSIHDVINYLLQTTYCCEERGKTDYMCTPNLIPEDDPVHRFSGYRCMNQTRPLSFQNLRCVANNTTPERMDFSTVTLDLGNLYVFTPDVTSKIRAYVGGLLKSEFVNGREFPSDGNGSCTIQQAIKTGCTRDVPNGFLSSHIFITLFWRQHNLIASNLAKYNPSWDDDKLFFTARDINIAIYVEIQYHEFWPALLGRNIMKQKGIIYDDPGFRDIYNPNVPLQLYLEYTLANRYFHTIQEGTQIQYSNNGTRIGSKQIVDYNNKIQDISIDDDIVTLVQGSRIQPGADFDYVVDPEMADRALGSAQATIDLCTQDINKGRYFGMAPYIQYRDLCTNYLKSHKTFKDLEYIVPKENLDMLRRIYEYPEDIELMTGIMMEKHIEGGYVPATAACIILTQLKRNIVYDRHWYERPNRPNAFTREQLYEIRKSTLAGLFCTMGDEITHNQRHAFLRISPKNPMVDCNKIPTIDFSLWKEKPKKYNQNHFFNNYNKGY